MAPRSAWERSSSGLHTGDRTLAGWASRGPSTNPPLGQTGENSPSRDKLCLGGGPMRMVLAIAALVSIAFGLIAVGRAWYEFRPLTDKERARLRQEGN